MCSLPSVTFNPPHMPSPSLWSRLLALALILALPSASAQTCPPGSAWTFPSQWPGGSGPQCLLCNPGSASSTVNSNFCVPCFAGQYQPNSGSTSCLSCQAGTISAGGATSCSACPPGQYSGVVAASCTACPLNTYNPNSGQGSCQQCPARHCTTATGAASVVQCSFCDSTIANLNITDEFGGQVAYYQGSSNTQGWDPDVLGYTAESSTFIVLDATFNVLVAPPAGTSQSSRFLFSWSYRCSPNCGAQQGMLLFSDTNEHSVTLPPVAIPTQGSTSVLLTLGSTQYSFVFSPAA